MFQTLKGWKLNTTQFNIGSRLFFLSMQLKPWPFQYMYT